MHILRCIIINNYEDKYYIILTILNYLKSKIEFFINEYL